MIELINPERPKIAPGGALWICDHKPFCPMRVIIGQGSVPAPDWVQVGDLVYCPKHKEDHDA